MQRNLILNVICILVGAVLTGVIFRSCPKNDELLLPDTIAEEARFDSLKALYDKRGDTILLIKIREDSLEKALIKNHKKVADAKQDIKNFTPDSRARWNDSVLRAAGYRKIVPNVP